MGRRESTTSVAIHYTVDAYLKRHGITGNIDHTSRYPPFFSTSMILDKINKNEPVALFGAFYNPISNSVSAHATLAYGYRMTMNGNQTSYEYIVHFGYNQYAKVYLFGTVGSIYSLQC